MNSGADTSWLAKGKANCAIVATSVDIRFTTRPASASALDLDFGDRQAAFLYRAPISCARMRT